MRKITALIAFLLSFLILHPRITLPQPATDLSVCEYKETRKPVPTNPKTNKPYTLEERNQEPFVGASISKEQIKQCLRAELRAEAEILGVMKPIQNHHIVFEDYRDAWREVAKEKGKYDIPLLIEGGVLHANTPYNEGTGEGGIGLWAFHEPTSSTLLIRPMIRWEGVFLDSRVTTFVEAKFSNTASFHNSMFNNIANFTTAIFSNTANFREATFNNTANFSGARFNEVDFIRTNFSNTANFAETGFSNTANFAGAIFSNTADFSSAWFRDQGSFESAIFEGNADFRGVSVEKWLRFDNTTWGGRVNLRGMSAKELHWDNQQNSSDVKSVLDFREALLGSATFKNAHFQDIADFSRTTFGQYKVKDKVIKHPSPQVLFENNTFEKETDFLHVTFGGSALLIDNRFRSSLDLTGASLTPPHSYLCLSYNRFSRFVLGPENLGNPPDFFPHRALLSLFDRPLHKSKIRQIAFKNKVELQCELPKATHTPTENTNRQVETLHAIYKILERSFREANDQGGVNKAWYLHTVAKRSLESNIWTWFSWLLLDVPSRYSVDVWRTVWISIVIMLGFYVPYVWVLRCVERRDGRVAIAKYDKKPRAFRIRLFEPIHHKDYRDSRAIVP